MLWNSVERADPCDIKLGYQMKLYILTANITDLIAIKVFLNFWRISAPLLHWFNVIRDDLEIGTATAEMKKMLDFAETNHEANGTCVKRRINKKCDFTDLSRAGNVLTWHMALIAVSRGDNFRYSVHALYSLQFTTRWKTAVFRVQSTVITGCKSNSYWPWETSSLPMNTDLNTFFGLACGSCDLQT
jgi:hypothetical protein